MNDAADFWRYNIGANVIPADTRNKTTSIGWTEYQTNLFQRNSITNGSKTAPLTME
jgi:hypothetical protein